MTQYANEYDYYSDQIYSYNKAINYFKKKMKDGDYLVGQDHRRTADKIEQAYKEIIITLKLKKKEVRNKLKQTE